MIEYTLELKKLLKQAEAEANKNKDSYVDSKHIFLALLKNNDEFKHLLKKYKVDYKLLLSNIISNDVFYNTYSLNLKKIIDNAFYYNKKTNSIDVNEVILSIIDNDEGELISLMNKLNVDIDYVYNYYKQKLNNNLYIYLKDIGINLSEKAKDDKVIGREKEIKRVIEILARKNKNNPILVGKAGVGKTAIVEELARRIKNDTVPLFLKNYKIIEISMSSLVAGTKYRGEFEEKFNKIIKELENNKKLILFVDEVHTLVGAGGAEGAIDASNILKPFLARNKIKMIGATTIDEYKKYIEKDKALDRRFQKVLIDEPTEEETLTILKKIKSDYEKHHNVIVDNKILELIVKLGSKYIHDRYEPDRSIDILDEVCAKCSVDNKEMVYKYKLTSDKNKINNKKKYYIKNKNYSKARELRAKEREVDSKIKKLITPYKTIVTKNALKNVLELKSNAKVYELNHRINYKQIEKKLKEIIVGQDIPITKILSIIKNHKTDRLPISFLFCGKLGVGKSLLSKNLSKYLNYNYIELDMNEYINSMSINRIIGSTQGYVGYDDNNTVFEEIKEKPNSIILIKDINKAHKKIKNLLLKIMDTGYLNTSKKDKIFFNNCIFISTTNSYNNSLYGFIKNNSNVAEKEITDRINNVIMFNSLNENDIVKIITNKKRHCSTTELQNILKKSDYKNVGAKKINNLINNKYIYN